ncbi:hypothetical protein [Maridesulfovibrio sp. FT414]|uniref:hypothetical protein n=1 Tax=Maridesulfovibrio sp. FT414 TaxID=2979469 RepID=UPI003D801723
MTGVESLVSVHRKEMALLREESRQSKRERRDSFREMDHSFNELRSRLNAEMPSAGGPSVFRGAVAFMMTLLGVLTY